MDEKVYAASISYWAIQLSVHRFHGFGSTFSITEKTSQQNPCCHHPWGLQQGAKLEYANTIWAVAGIIPVY